MNVLELFSGIGGFSKGLADAGFNITEHYFAEIDKHAIANYKYNFPNAKHIGSVTDISGRDFTGIDIITFGSPCQDFSLAGKREGMDGKRSVLILEAIRLITELRPPVFIWENVKGAFSSNSGADFWGILQAFANIGGYRLEWQLLNTKWFLPQNRERIYLVGHLAGSERSFGNVFPISEDNCFSYKRRKDQEKIHILAQTLTAGDFKSQRGNFLQIGALRGRNPDNPSQRIAGQYQEQVLEINENNISNTLSTVQKDNVVVSGLSMERTEEGKRLRKNYEAGKIDHGYNEHRQPVPRKDLVSNTIDTNEKSRLIIEETNIRRLTEIECERLQGFPDDWTKYGIYEKQVWINKKEGTFEIVQNVYEIPKTQRYKMLGNAVTVRIVEEIGKKLIQNKWQL